MKAVLEALEAGRLIELPENDKQKALTLLASLVEAVPSVHPGSKIVEAVLAREGQANTYLGDGWAVPHARTAEEGEMLCAIGWSPAGIAYGGRDGASARMLLLYYVPDNQRAAYLKEISSLARLLHENGAMRDVSQAATLNDVRLRLLDIVTAALGSGQAEARARMIRLEARTAAVAAGAPAAPTFDPSLVVPAWIVHTSDGGVMVLARDETVVKTLEAQADLGTRLERQPIVSVAGYVIHIRQGATYGLGRSLFDCLVVKQPGVAAAPGAA
jgi:mannitol/fructose-specific phosphotransferase system IIA component (Ntr-type)